MVQHELTEALRRRYMELLALLGHFPGGSCWIQKELLSAFPQASCVTRSEAGDCDGLITLDWWSLTFQSKPFPTSAVVLPAESRKTVSANQTEDGVMQGYAIP